MNKLLTVTVRDRHGIHFQGPAQSLSSSNKGGPFDILPGHAHFLSLITNDVFISSISGQKTSFPVIKQGMISVVDDAVTVLLGVVPDQTNLS